MATVAHDVFISYASEDKPIADAVCAKLESRGIRCWIAPRDVPAGTPFGKTIVDAIGTSGVFVLVFSSKSNGSDHVKREADCALSEGMPILPLRVEDVMPSDEMKYYLAGQHWLDALTPPLEQHLEKLGDAVAYLLGPEPEGTDYEAPTAQQVTSHQRTIAQTVGAPEPVQEQVDAEVEARAIVDAVAAGDTEAVEELLGRGADANTRDNEGRTLLHIACRRDDGETVRLLLDRNVDVDAKDVRGDSALHTAACQSNLEMASWLLDHNADLHGKRRGGETPLHVAAREGHAEMARLLLQHGADVNAKDDRGYTSLHFAARLGRATVGRLLVEESAHTNAKDKHGNTPLHLAAKHRHTEMATLLRGQVNARNHRGETPLHLAADAGHTDVVTWLLGHKADVNARDDHGHTPLRLAAKSGHTEVADLLREHGGKAGCFTSLVVVVVALTLAVGSLALLLAR